MLRQPFQWRVKTLEKSRRDETKLVVRAQFLGGDGADHRTTILDTYDFEDVSRVESLLYAIRLFPTDVLWLIDTRQIEGAMERYLVGGRVIQAVCQIRTTGGRGTPYALFEHRPVQGQEFDRASIGLPPARISYEVTQQWIATKSQTRSGSPETNSPMTGAPVLR